MGTLLSFRNALEAKGGQVVLAAVNTPVKRALKHTRLRDLLVIYETLDAALA